MRVYQPDTSALFDVLQDELTEERRLSRAGLSDQIAVLAPGKGVNTKWNVATPLLSLTQDYVVLFHSNRPLLREKARRVAFMHAKCQHTFGASWHGSRGV